MLIFFQQICDALAGRFKERDANVKVAVFRTTIHLLQLCVVTRGAILDPFSFRTRVEFPAHTSFRSILAERTKIILLRARNELNKDRCTNEIKKVVFELYSYIIVVLGGSPEFLSVLMPQVFEMTQAEDVQLKAHALSFLKILVLYHCDDDLAPFLQRIAVVVVEMIQVKFVKIKSEALHLCVHVTRDSDQMTPLSEDTRRDLFKTVLQELQTKDTDQEVKEAALIAMGSLVVAFGSQSGDVVSALSVIVERLKNELTRPWALRTLSRIAQSDQSSCLNPIAAATIELCVGFLKQDSTALRQETIISLSSLLSSDVVKIVDDDLLAKLLGSVEKVINDSNLHLSHLVLDLVSIVLSAKPLLSKMVIAKLTNPVIKFIKSPLLQGIVLQSVVNLFSHLISGEESDAFKTFEQLRDILMNQPEFLPIANCIVIASCVAVMIARLTTQQQDSVVDGFVQKISANDQDTRSQHLCLLVLGEVGRETALSRGRLDKVLGAFQSENERVRQAASFAFGNIVVGNLSKFLPLALELIQNERSKKEHLFLSSLKEIITRSYTNNNNKSVLENHIPQITKILFEHAKSDDDGVREAVAECLGGIAQDDRQGVLTKMKEGVSSSSPSIRSTCVHALRFAFPKRYDEEKDTRDTAPLRAVFPAFVPLLSDDDLMVRKQALLTVNVVAHGCVEVLEDNGLLHSTVLPLLYQATKPDKSLVRVVDFGPFKQTFDDGLALRKAAYQSLETLLTQKHTTLDVTEYIRHLQNGLVDHDDVQISTYVSLTKLAQIQPQALLETLDELPPKIMTGVKGQLKRAKGSEPEKPKEVLRTAVRCMSTIIELDGVNECTKFTDFYARVLKTALLAQMLKEIEAE